MTEPVGTKVWMVLAVKEGIEVIAFGTHHPLNLLWAEGMVGVVPVFADEDSARKYAEGRYIVKACVVKE